MATISSLGTGSGLELSKLVDELVAAERAPRQTQLTRRDSRLTTELSAVSQLKGAMSTLQTAVNGLRTTGSFATNATRVGDEQYFTASAGSSAAMGAYDVQVQQLATAARLGSRAYTEGTSSTVGTGTLSIAVGSKTLEIEITEDSDSLAQIRDAINNAPGNTSVRATLIRDETGTYLALSGTKTGADNAITVSATDADAGLSQLVGDLNAFDAAKDSVAQDAIAFVSGYEIHSSSNTLSNAIDGVTLNLKKVTPDGEVVSLGVSRDDAAIQTKAESFVTAFNALSTVMTSLGKYDAATETAGALLGDSMLRGMQTQLRRMLSDPVAGTTGDYRTLSSLGISMDATGQLKLDAEKFKDALTEDPDAVNRIFSSEGGVAEKMGVFLDDKLASDGELAARDTRINEQLRKLQDDYEALDARMAVIEQRYIKQFTALDALLTQLQSTSSYLEQQLDALSNKD